MNILWFSWKDISHPLAGGAEAMSHKLMRRLAEDSNEILCITSGYKGCKSTESNHGITTVRLGNRYTIYLLAAIYFLRNLRGWPDLVIEEINTIPFMTQWYTKKSPTLLIYQLCREIWFYEMFLPLNIIGYLLEPVYLFFLRKNSVLTESWSTKSDLMRFYFDERRIHVFPIAIDKSTESIVVGDKYPVFTVLSLGSMRKMKRTLDQVKAFELARDKQTGLRLLVAGNAFSDYGQGVIEYISKSRHSKAIKYLGPVSASLKVELMAKSHVILMTSVKEGWGLIVTEAARLGTPAVVYDVDGLRESVVSDKTGIVAPNKSIIGIAEAIQRLAGNKALLNTMSSEAHKHSLQFNVNNSYKVFKESLLRT